MTFASGSVKKVFLALTVSLNFCCAGARSLDMATISIPISSNFGWLLPNSVNSRVQAAVNAAGKNVKSTFFFPAKSFIPSVPAWAPRPFSSSKSGGFSPSFGVLSAPGTCNCAYAATAAASNRTGRSRYVVDFMQEAYAKLPPYATDAGQGTGKEIFTGNVLAVRAVGGPRK